MTMPPDRDEYELLCAIVSHGSGSKVLKIARQYGVSGGTICLGRGTVKSRVLEFLGLNNVEKEIIFMIAESATAHGAIEGLHKELAFDKPHHGIAFLMPVINFLGARGCEYRDIQGSRGVEDTMYNAIFVVVDRGRAEVVLDAATKAGSRGATIINARGSGIHETNVLFAMAIEPEKEIVLILSEDSLTESIVSTIREALQIDEPGRGILFTLGVKQAYGLY